MLVAVTGVMTGMGVAPPLNFSLWENVLVKKLSSKNIKSRAGNPLFGEFRGRIRILSTCSMMQIKNKQSVGNL